MLPRPGLLFTVNDAAHRPPRCAWRMTGRGPSRRTAAPRLHWPGTNGRNSRFRSAATMPMPVSATVNVSRNRRAPPAATINGERYPAALGELHRVVDQVLQRAAQPHRIGADAGRQLVRDGDLDAERLAFGARPERLRDRIDEIAQRERLGLQDQPAAAGLRGVDHQRGQPRQMAGGILDRRGPAPLALRQIGGEQQLGQAPACRSAACGCRGRDRRARARWRRCARGLRAGARVRRRGVWPGASWSTFSSAVSAPDPRPRPWITLPRRRSCR